jgi:hypothetical protein
MSGVAGRRADADDERGSSPPISLFAHCGSGHLSAAFPHEQHCAGPGRGPTGRPQFVEAVAQRNRGLRRSQSRHEPILTDVLYGSLGAFDGIAGLICPPARASRLLPPYNEIEPAAVCATASVPSEREQRRRARACSEANASVTDDSRGAPSLQAIVPGAPWALAKPPGCRALRHPSPRSQ